MRSSCPCSIQVLALSYRQQLLQIRILKSDYSSRILITSIHHSLYTCQLITLEPWEPIKKGRTRLDGSAALYHPGTVSSLYARFHYQSVLLLRRTWFHYLEICHFIMSRGGESYLYA